VSKFSLFSLCALVVLLSGCGGSLVVENFGGGVVTSDDEFINCGEDCKKKYTNSSPITVSLFAEADTGYQFCGWDYASCGSSTECSVGVGSSGTTTVGTEFSPQGEACSAVLGVIDGIQLVNGEYEITGWACQTGDPQSIDVHLYVDGPAGVGTVVKGVAANLSSEPEVREACKTDPDNDGIKHRFRIPLSYADIEAHAGKTIYVHGISSVNSGNLLINNSGKYSINLRAASVTPCFDWLPEPGATEQHIEVYASENPDSLFGKVEGLNSTADKICWEGLVSSTNSGALPALDVNTVYFWRVRSMGIEQEYSGFHPLVTRPNIVMIYADDLGWNDVNVGIGNTTVEINAASTNIKTLADRGVTFTNAYANAAVCSPSRASLLTGRYSPDTGVYRVSDNDDFMELPEKLRGSTLPRRLQGMGYETVLIGKWHLQNTSALRSDSEIPGDNSVNNMTTALNAGFTYNIAGSAPGKPNAYEAFDYGDGLGERFKGKVVDKTPDLKIEYRKDGSDYAVEILKPIETEVDGENNDLTATLSEYARNYISGDSFTPGKGGSTAGALAQSLSRDTGKPYFLYLSHYGPHVQQNHPGRTPDEEREWVSHRCHADPTEPESERYLCMINDVDNSVRIVVEELENTLGGTDSTYVIFTSDNGVHPKWVDSPASNELYDPETLLAGHKGLLTEGGIREPLVIAGPSINAKSISTTPVIGSDLYATILALAGENKDVPSESVDLRAELNIEPGSQELAVASVPEGRPLFWYYPDPAYTLGMSIAKNIDNSRYKLINYFHPLSADEDIGEPIELYDLENDGQETCNLVSQASYNSGCAGVEWETIREDVLKPLAKELCDFVHEKSLNSDTFIMAKSINNSLPNTVKYIDPGLLYAESNPVVHKYNDPATENWWDLNGQLWTGGDGTESLSYCGVEL